jgi:hypothetical protein
VPVEGTVVYEDDFEDPGVGRLLQESYAPKEVRFAYEGGEFVIEKFVPEHPSSPHVYLPESELQDVVVRVEARLVGEVDNRFVAVSCRTDPDEGIPAYRLAVAPGNSSFFLDRWEGGGLVRLDEGVGLDAIRSGTATNAIELSCVGSTIAAQVNGVQVTSVQDTAVTEGWATIGAGTLAGVSGTVEAHFDNLEVLDPA